MLKNGTLIFEDASGKFENSDLELIDGKVILIGDCNKMFYNANNFDCNGGGWFSTEWDMKNVTDTTNIFYGVASCSIDQKQLDRFTKTENVVDRLDLDMKFWFTETGLKLSEDMLYKLISGPVSLKYYESSNKKTAFFLLFGDFHNSYGNICNVECNYKNQCTNLHDEDFLRELNRLSGRNKKVNFYLLKITFSPLQQLDCC